MTCGVADCDRPVKARGWCNRHWLRWSRHGDPLGGGADRPRGSDDEKFWRNVDKGGDCWIWTGTITADGYGVAYDSTAPRKQSRAHRVSYQLNIGPIPDGLEVDHRCRNRACVKPGHLRAVTKKQNRENQATVGRRSSTGVRGVHLCPDGRYRSVVGHEGRQYHAGRFATLEEATAAVVAKRLQLHTHNEEDRVRNR